MKHGQYAKGFRSMNRLRAHPIIAARDYYYSYVIYIEELTVAGGQGYFARLWDCFRVPRIRRANYGASTVMLAQQMCGINSKIFCDHSLGFFRLTVSSHFLLQLDNLRKRIAGHGQSTVCIFGLWCHSSRLHHSYSLFDRYQRSSNSDSNRKFLANWYL